MRIYLSPPHVTGNEQQYLQQVLATGWLAPVGPQLNEFEQQVADYVGIKNAVALNSGTAAIHLGLQLLGVTQGDKILCPTFTFVASINPIVYLGATPVFIDSEQETWNICPQLLEQAIVEETKKGQKPKGLVLVQGYGMPAKMEGIIRITEKYGLFILEDAAGALGSSYKNKACGTFGDLGVFSFNGNKIITTSAGGMLLSNKEALIDQALFLATQAKDSGLGYQHSEIGYNYRMSNVLAGLGLGQLACLPEFITKKRNIFKTYKNALSHLPITFLEETTEAFSNYWLTNVLFKDHETQERVRLALLAKEIESRPLWKPMHEQELYKNKPCYQNGISDDLYNRGLSLPSGVGLTTEELTEIVEVIVEVL